MSNPTGFQNWYANLPIPWLVAGTNGQAESNTWPSLLDFYVSLLKQAIKARFPDYAPTDALPHIGGDRGLVQGPSETNQSFITRINAAWTEWSWAGTFAEMLCQIYWGGFAGYNEFVIVQQNGLIYSLGSQPVAGQTPDNFVNIATVGTLNNVFEPFPSQFTKQIPASTHWWTFDGATDMCSRFALLFTNNASLTTAQISSLGSVIRRWRRGTQTCVGVYNLTSGVFWGYGGGATWGSGGNWGPSSVATINGTWQ